MGHENCLVILDEGRGLCCEELRIATTMYICCHGQRDPGNIWSEVDGKRKASNW